MIGSLAWSCLAMEVEADAHETFATPDKIEALAEGVATFLGIPMPGQDAHLFEPFGVSLVRFGVKGRLAIHTWPERRVITLDVWAPASVLEARARELLDWVSSSQSAKILAARLFEADGSLTRPLA